MTPRRRKPSGFESPRRSGRRLRAAVRGHLLHPQFQYTKYDVDPRSGRFLMMKSESDDDVPEIVVLNCFEEVQRRMGN